MINRNHMKHIFPLVLGLALAGMGLRAEAQTNVTGPVFKNEPSNAAELAAKKSTAGWNLEADARCKATMSPAELAWEKTLEENLGGFYLPIYKRDKLAGKETAWDYVKDDPKLPCVLLIGDSISRGYTLAVRHDLAGKANVHRAPANCGATAYGLEKLSVWLGDGKWTVIHFNFGIHDRSTPLSVYAANLEKIVAELQQTGAKLVWARTTPPASAENNEKFSEAQCERLNRVADEIMQRHGIPEDDLYTLIQPRLAELQLPHNVHFQEQGYEVLGRQVADSIIAVLPLAQK